MLKTSMEEAVASEFKHVDQRNKQQYNDLMNRLDELKKEIEVAGKNKATKKEMKDNISKVIELVDEKVSLKEV